jgi:sugar lactone lactonase YvrE
MPEAQRLTSSCMHHGEGPFWDSRSNRLMCLDVLASTIVTIDPVGEIRRYKVPSRAATVIRRRKQGGFLIATERGVAMADESLTKFDELVELVCEPDVRTNDGGCDPLGGFVVGTMSYDETPARGAVYRVTSNQQNSRILVAPVSISNGVQWSADGTKVYYIDTPTRRVDVFDFESQTGEWSGRRAHIQMRNTRGFPDGMAIDEDDGLWIALWGAGVVNHYDKYGCLVETIAVPGVTQVSSCAFGGRDRSVLYITTSRKDLRPDCEPDAGAVFFVQTSVRGAALAEFAG